MVYSGVDDVRVFLNISVLHGGVISTSLKLQAGGPPLVGCPRRLIQFIRSYSPYRRPFLYPQPEDAPCLGDRAHYMELEGTRSGIIMYTYIYI